MIGQVFGRLTVAQLLGSDKFARREWLCRCECGKWHVTLGVYLRKGEVKSCGCLRHENNSNYKHGHRRPNHGRATRAYSCWMNLRNRCNNPNLRQFKDWGGRGITYDPRWDDFSAFLADMGEPPEGLTLDRKDNDGNYSKENCRWATRDEQRRNNRQIHWVVLDGDRMCLRDYCNRVGLKYYTVLNRISRGASVEDAIDPNRWSRWR